MFLNNVSDSDYEITKTILRSSIVLQHLKNVGEKFARQKMIRNTSLAKNRSLRSSDAY